MAPQEGDTLSRVSIGLGVWDQGQDHNGECECGNVDLGGETQTAWILRTFKACFKVSTAIKGVLKGFYSQ